MMPEEIIIDYLIHRGNVCCYLTHNREPALLKEFRKKTKQILSRSIILKVKILDVVANAYTFKIINNNITSPNFSFAELEYGVNSIPLNKIVTILVCPKEDESLSIIYHSKA